jgi:hypothetical protein
MERNPPVVLSRAVTLRTTAVAVAGTLKAPETVIATGLWAENFVPDAPTPSH